MKILLFDIHISGHHSEYIQHLVDYIVQDKSLSRYFFVVHPHFTSQFPMIYQKSLNNGNISWVPVTDEELNQCNHGGLAKRSLANYRTMNLYASKVEADHVVLLSLNIFQFALSIFRPPYTISGILFKQFVRISKNGNLWRYYRKYLQTKFLVWNSKISEIFILNDVSTVSYLNKEFKTLIFKVLPDPVPELNPLEGFDIYKEYNISRERNVFLHIGSLDERKGTLAILDALALLPSDIRKLTFVLLVGKAKGEIGDRIRQKIDDLDLSTFCYWDDCFVTNGKMKSLFLNCYCVLIPYKNNEASSGILGHAAASNKPVIGPSLGLLGELIKVHNLGITIEECTPKLISEAIESSLEIPLNINEKNIEFVLNHKPSFFSETILK